MSRAPGTPTRMPPPTPSRVPRWIAASSSNWTRGRRKVLTEGGRVTGVETTAGVIQAPVVVIAAGAWANELFAPLGIDLGLVPVAARVTLFRWAFDRSPQHLTYIDQINNTWARPVDGNCTLIGAESGVRVSPDPEHAPEAVDEEYIQVCREKLVARFPVMRHSTVRGNWAGVLMMSPDARPIIDKLPQHEGLYCMTGDSGTSFKTSPAIGKCLAEWITEGQPEDGRSDALPLDALRRGQAVGGRVQLRRRPRDDLALRALFLTPDPSPYADEIAANDQVCAAMERGAQEAYKRASSRIIRRLGHARL